MESLEITKESLDNQRERGPGRAPAARRQPAVRQDLRGARRAGLRQLGLQALGHRLDGRSQRGDGGRRGDVLQDLLRAEQRRPLDRRRRRYQEDDGDGRASTSRRSRRSRRRRSVDIDRAAAGRRAPRAHRRSAGAARRASTWPTRSRRRVARRRPRSTVLSTVLSSGRSSRFYEVIVRQKQLATGASPRSPRTRAAPACSGSSARSRPARRRRSSRPRSTRRSRRSRPEPIADWEIEKARNGARSQRSIAGSAARSSAPSSSASTRCSTTSPNMINTRADEIAKVTAADVQRVAKKYLVEDRPHGGQHRCRSRRHRREASNGAHDDVTRHRILSAAIALGLVIAAARRAAGRRAAADHGRAWCSRARRRCRRTCCGSSCRSRRKRICRTACT